MRAPFPIRFVRAYRECREPVPILETHYIFNPRPGTDEPPWERKMRLSHDHVPRWAAVQVAWFKADQ